MLVLLSLAAAVPSAVQAENDGRRHVLLLHSYHKGMTWVDDITNSVATNFKSGGLDVELHVEYMDTKRVTTPEHIDNLYREYRHKFSRQKYDAVVTADDAALHFALKHHEELFPTAPVVFCGVNNLEAHFTDNRPYVTGVLEDLDVEETLRVALAFHPQVKQVFVVNDTSETGRGLHKRIMEGIRPFRNRVSCTFLENFSIQELGKRLRTLPADSLVLRSAFFIDRDGVPLPDENHSAKVVERNTSVPLYTFWDYYVGLGAIGGKLVSGAVQGDLAAHLVMRILNGEKPSAIPVVMKSPNRFEFDYNQLKRYGIKISALPSDSLVRNEPVPFYSINKTLTWIVAAFTATVTVISVILVVNIRWRKKSEAALREREQMLSLIVDTVPQAIFWKNRDLAYLGCNANFARLAGVNVAADLKGKTDFDMPWGTAQAESYRRDDNEVLSGTCPKHHLVEKVQNPAGQELYLDTTRMPLKASDGSMMGILGVFEDITERKKMEEDLRTSGERLRLIFETSQAGILLINVHGEIDFANSRMAEMLGFPLEDLVGSSYMEYVDPADLPSVEENIRDLIDGKADHVVLERQYRRRDGSRFWGYLSSKGLRKGDGGSALVITINDITELKMAHDELKEEKERLTVTLASIGDGVITVDTAERIVMMNRTAERLCGWTSDEAEGMPLHQIFRIISEFTREIRKNPASQALVSGEIVELANHTLLVTKDGRELVINDSAAPIRDRDGKIIGVVLVFRDVTEKQQIEEELFKARKLESLGVLAGGIAHDFNNLLAGILGNLSLAREFHRTDERTCQILDAAVRATERATDLTRQLLTFSRGGAPVRKLAALGPVLHESATFALRGSNVRCEFRIAPDLWNAEFDGGQISQVINNLVINADQAMPDGGTLFVGAENVAGADGDGRFVRIVIRDEGSGIAEENLPRIFDPYFTTKPSGSGLGLATVYSIICNHLGEIRVSSKVGEGTSIEILLPASAGEILPSPARSAGMPRRTGGRVLVMDDEELILDVAGEMLKILGYCPTMCRDGEDALTIYMQAMKQGEPFDAVIMDLTVPGGTGGKEAARDLLAVDANARIIVSSGYSNDPVMARYTEFGFCNAIAKPYRVEVLAAALDSALCSSADGSQ